MVDVPNYEYNQSGGSWLITGYNEGDTASVELIVEANPSVVRNDSVTVSGGERLPTGVTVRYDTGLSYVTINFTDVTRDSNEYYVNFTNSQGRLAVKMKLLPNCKSIFIIYILLQF